MRESIAQTVPVAFGAYLHGYLLVPQAHVRVRIAPVGHLVATGDMDDRKAVAAEPGKQPLHRGNDTVVHVLAGERVPRPRPCIGEIDIDQRRLATEADAALEAAVPINPRGLGKGCLQRFLQFRCHRMNLPDSVPTVKSVISPPRRCPAPCGAG
jgi:hypothetical protein